MLSSSKKRAASNKAKAMPALPLYNPDELIVVFNHNSSTIFRIVASLIMDECFVYSDSRFLRTQNEPYTYLYMYLTPLVSFYVWF